MEVELIREALHRQPFEPFIFRLADGRALPVVHPDFVALGQKRVIVVAADDSSSVIEPLMIVSIDHGNGKSGNRMD